MLCHYLMNHLCQFWKRNKWTAPKAGRSLQWRIGGGSLGPSEALFCCQDLLQSLPRFLLVSNNVGVFEIGIFEDKLGFFCSNFTVIFDITIVGSLNNTVQCQISVQTPFPGHDSMSFTCLWNVNFSFYK